jgi:hypothetical protein
MATAYEFRHLELPPDRAGDVASVVGHRDGDRVHVGIAVPRRVGT